jgi:TRAP-type mannitol/chloroaromatic compound transport system permease small subunit
VFLLCAGYTLLHNEHIRIDVVARHLSRRAQIWIDIFGTVFFCCRSRSTSCGVLAGIHERLEQRRSLGSAGGLIRWPARLLVPAGFFLLSLAGRVRADQARRLPERADPRPVEHHEDPALEQLRVEEGKK